MIPISDLSWQTLSWQELLKNSITRVDDLLQQLNLPNQTHYSDFPILVPLPFLSRIKKETPKDPLLLQVLSSKYELGQIEGYLEDPLEESDFSPIKGLIHKYYGRLLVIATGACAINCRYCFRRHFPYQSFQADTFQWDKIIKHIRQDSSISELILSGGDPFMLPNRRLKSIITQLESIPHLTTLRFHTRLPVVIPQRMDIDILDCLGKTPLNIVLVNHINHANEIDNDVIEAMGKLRQKNVTLLNQSVLLSGINDSLDALIRLSEKMFIAGILPYYLHLLDPVSGAAHFNVENAKAIHLIDELRKHLPGYLVPKLVKELPAQASKQPIA